MFYLALDVDATLLVLGVQTLRKTTNVPDKY